MKPAEYLPMNSFVIVYRRRKLIRDRDGTLYAAFEMVISRKFSQLHLSFPFLSIGTYQLSNLHEFILNAILMLYIFLSCWVVYSVRHLVPIIHRAAVAISSAGYVLLAIQVLIEVLISPFNYLTLVRQETAFLSRLHFGSKHETFLECIDLLVEIPSSKILTSS